ncbi:TetR/AcrR family transcriptional regulator [Mycolicibacterium brumae]|uniref:TetR/AcrR family transcriptional regulator n=1 Tax=Mycolicibacterium brumae TaxID=85968 RepID=A0A2G5P4X2_9MYCO|nr:TetR/AcrR family transcriptional regulator [Mycolicibacterium brumae]MCV7191348.1 TetR/AcrR family transcriptional regulator [Mycolicibacterium brumae]PIB73392.1 TetR/AcrR family transcriptional regulator [Mycolicibacterium brumae]UWW07396.1 TetR/AcrR family transcriptional regulator [Mycolicibacterium brumae]
MYTFARTGVNGLAEKAGYHHGDLATALVEAGLALTRAGGPEALTIRAATRQAGVSPNAAYRHFADREALLAAVGSAIETRMALQMAAEFPAAPAGRSLLAAVGLGYIRFALAEPGWFSVAFFSAGAEVSDSPPFLALVAALDAMVAEGSLALESRDGAEWPCWSAVHGFAELALRGPLRGASAEQLDALAARTVDDIIAGVCGAPGRD